MPLCLTFCWGTMPHFPAYSSGLTSSMFAKLSCAVVSHTLTQTHTRSQALPPEGRLDRSDMATMTGNTGMSTSRWSICFCDFRFLS